MSFGRIALLALGVSVATVIVGPWALGVAAALIIAGVLWSARVDPPDADS